MSSILNPKANIKHIIAPADAPEYSFILSSLFSIVFKYPSIEKIPIAPGPITRYSISSFNNTEEIAFSK